MAGRGTDIKLKPGVAELGGLHVIGTTRHQSRRIDRQLRGRCARLGDPGSSKFYVSFEDSLMRLFTSPKVTAFLQRFRPPEGEAISAGILNKSIETAQKRVEQRNYTMRKHTLEYDDVMNKQRAEIYSFRNEALSTNDTITLAKELMESLCSQMAHRHLSGQRANLSAESYRQWLLSNFPVSLDMESTSSSRIEDLEKMATDKILKALDMKIEREAETIEKIQMSLPDTAPKAPPHTILNEVIRNLLIRNIDKYWQEHLLHIDHLRTEVHMRAIGQKDPLTEFKHEAFALFDAFSLKIKVEIAHAIFKFEMLAPPSRPIEQEAPRRLPGLKRPLFSLSDLTLEDEELATIDSE
jgi:preprotein translocase subunit SecA